MNREVDSISVQDIELLPGRRPVSPEAVSRLVESIRRIGLRTPISVRLVDNFTSSSGEVCDGVPVLVTGAHRLAAARELGWEKIPCVIMSTETEAQARLWEIAENLHRAELTALERDENLEEWRRLTLEQVRQLGAPSGGQQPKDKGHRKTAKEFGVSEQDVRRAEKVASLTPEAKEAAREAGLDDNRSALLTASKAAPEQQAEVIRGIADQKAERALLKPEKAATPSPDKESSSLPQWTDGHEEAYAALTDAWDLAPHEVRMQFLSQHISARYRSAA